MTEIEPEAVKRLKDIAEAGAGDGRMFTLEDGREIIAYIERLEKRAPTAPSGGDVDRLVNQLKAEHHRNGGQGAYAWQSRELCGKAAAAIAAMRPASGVFAIGDRVTKIKGSAWTGRVVGTYSTALTPEGYAIESENELGSVQIYPAAALTAPAPSRSIGGSVRTGRSVPQADRASDV